MHLLYAPSTPRKLALGKGLHRHHMGAASQRLTRGRQRVVPSGSRQHIPRGAQISVQLCLDGAEDKWDVLELVDADWCGPVRRDEQPGIRGYGTTGLEVVEV